MPFPILVAALVLGQDPQDAGQVPAVAPAAAPDFTSPFAVAEPVRLAMTPKIDGLIATEEWDPISSSTDLKAFLQWEPGKIHLAGTCATGHDLVLSLDLKSNGWLVGNDNIEIRVSNSAGAVKVTARRLDASNVQGPVWSDLPGIGLAAKGAAVGTDLATTFEVTLSDADLNLFPTNPDRGLNLRVDSIPASMPPLEPFLPRATAAVKFAFERAAAIPVGLKWGIQGAGSSTMAGGGVKVRYTFNGNDKLGLRRLSLRSEGAMKDATTVKSLPFPIFDNKGRAFVDYETDIRPDAEAGWAVSRGELEAGDGLTGIIQASYRVAPIVEIELGAQKVKTMDKEQRVKLSYDVVSNAPRRLAGTYRITVPNEFHLVSPSEGKFMTFGGRARTKLPLEFDVAAGAKGVFPVQIRTETDGILTDSVVYINIQ